MEVLEVGILGRFHCIGKRALKYVCFFYSLHGIPPRTHSRTRPLSAGLLDGSRSGGVSGVCRPGMIGRVS